MSARGSSSTYIQSVARAARVLKAISRERSGMTAQEVSSQLGLTLSTSYHLLSTLVGERMLAKVEGRRYVLGPDLGEIASAIVRDLRPPMAFIRSLRQVADETGETAYLTGWHVGTIKIVATVEGRHAVRVAGLETGFTESVHARASSKLLLAFAEPETRRSLLRAHTLARYTPSTITDEGQFAAELERIRSTSISYDREEYSEGVCTVALPIMADGAVVAALAVSAPVQRFERDESTIVECLRSACTAAGA